MALEYKKRLQPLAPSVTFLMTLYLSSSLTPEEIKRAAENGITGVKSYPKGVTTNSDSGIEDYSIYYPIFEAMEKHGLVLNLHGEIPSGGDVCVLNAEERFLTHLKTLHTAFPKLKIILEHATTRAAVDMVSSLGPSVACTITIHHLELLVDDWAGCCHNFCKPVAKFPYDREALRNAVKSGNPKFFLGTDSAPHPRHKKEGPTSAAGVFTGARIGEYLVHALDSFGALDRLVGFACRFGRQFYGIQTTQRDESRGIIEFTVSKGQDNNIVEKSIKFVDDQGDDREVVPFKAGKALDYKLKVNN